MIFQLRYLFLLSCLLYSCGYKSKYYNNFILHGVKNLLIGIPASWSDISTSDLQTTKDVKDIYAFQPKCKENEYCKNLVIRFLDNSNDYQLRDYSKSTHEAMMKRYKEYNLIRKYDTTINELPVDIIVYNLSEQGYKIIALNAFTRLDNSIIQIGITSSANSADDLMKAKKLHSEIISTLRKNE